MVTAAPGMTKGNLILAAVSRIESVDPVGLYAIMLAKRTGMSVCLLLALDKQGGNPQSASLGIDVLECMRRIKEEGELEKVKVDYLIVSNFFKEEVIHYMKKFDASILVSGEGHDRKVRCEELREIERALESDTEWYRSRSHHFLVISGKKHNLVGSRNKKQKSL